MPEKAHKNGQKFLNWTENKQNSINLGNKNVSNEANA